MSSCLDTIPCPLGLTSSMSVSLYPALLWCCLICVLAALPGLGSPFSGLPLPTPWCCPAPPAPWIPYPSCSGVCSTGMNVDVCVCSVPLFVFSLCPLCLCSVPFLPLCLFVSLCVYPASFSLSHFCLSLSLFVSALLLPVSLCVVSASPCL